jgi:uncharacterized protein (DUF1330 family)
MTTRLVVLVSFVAILCAIGARAMQASPKAYLVVQVDVTNPQQYGEYTKLSPAIIEKFGGHFLARGGRSTTLEGPPAPGRVVVIEFPSFERAQAFYNSPEYVAARKVRAGAATAQFVLVEGTN